MPIVIALASQKTSKEAGFKHYNYKERRECVCVCVCVREREREKERLRKCYSIKCWVHNNKQVDNSKV